jgi:hypothetical protein
MYGTMSDDLTTFHAVTVLCTECDEYIPLEDQVPDGVATDGRTTDPFSDDEVAYRVAAIRDREPERDEA